MAVGVVGFGVLIGYLETWDFRFGLCLSVRDSRYSIVGGGLQPFRNCGRFGDAALLSSGCQMSDVGLLISTFTSALFVCVWESGSPFLSDFGLCELWCLFWYAESNMIAESNINNNINTKHTIKNLKNLRKNPTIT